MARIARPSMLTRLTRRISRAVASAYKTAGTGARSSAWRPGNYGPNAAIEASAVTLRAQSRDMARNNALASSAIERIVSNIVGTGIKPKLTDETMAALWTRWTDEADAAGVLDFYGLQEQAVRCVAQASEVFIRKRNRLPQDGLSVPLQIELLEPEFVPIDYNVPATDTQGEIRQGIEFDRVLRSKRVAYWVYRVHPNDNSGAFLNELVRVPASEIDHVYLPLRPGQLRGEPWLARVLDRLKEVEEYALAELTRKKVAAMFVGFIRRALPDGLTLDELKSMWGEEEGTEISNGVGVVQTAPGQFNVLTPGEDVEFAAPPDVGGMYEVFLRNHHRAIAGALGILYEQLTGDYSQVNDRTWRAAVQEFRRRCEQWQHNLVVFQMCRPVFARWLDLAILARALPRTAAGFVPQWTPPAWPYINPEQDVAARREEVLAGFRSRAAVVSEMGGDIEALDRELAADQKRADSLGLVLKTDGRLLQKPEPAPASNDNGGQQGAAASAMFDAFKAFASARPAPVTVTVPERLAVDAVKTIGPTYTEVVAKDDAGRIKQLRIVPVAGGPATMRTVFHDEHGRITGHQDEIEGAADAG